MLGLCEQALLFVGLHYERTPFLDGEKMEEGEGERNFDLESKHDFFKFFFAYQVLQQSKKKKKLSRITDAKSQATVDSHL